MCLARLVWPLLPAVCLLAAPARADVYQWVDAQGRLNMTDNLSQVPPAYRAAAQRSQQKSKPESDAPRWNLVETQPQVPASPVTIQTIGESRKHVIPVERAGTRLTVAARLNGTQYAWFKVDTGAEVNMVPRSVVDQMGIPIDASTPTMSVVGISGQPMELPIITFDEVRLGEARVKNVEMVVNDRRSYGLLGMTFFNHFKVHTDPTGGRLVLEEVDLEGAEGVHGGFGESYWRREFRNLHTQLARIEEERKSLPSTHVTWHEQLDTKEGAVRKRLNDLHERAARHGVPQSWRD